MSFLDIFAAANDQTFQSRCQVALWIAAQNIAAEAEDTPNHANRKGWADRVLQDRAVISGRQLAMQVLRNPVISGAPMAADDGAIQYQVNSVIDSIITIG